MIREEFEISLFPRSKVNNVIKDLVSIAEPHTVHPALQQSAFDFSAPYLKDGEVFQVAIKLYYGSTILEGMLPVEPPMHAYQDTLRLTLESRTLGEGKLVPSSIIALSDLLEEYGFTLLQREGVLKNRT